MVANIFLMNFRLFIEILDLIILLLIERKYKSEEIFKNLLSYYVQSDFPRKLINKVDNEVLIKFIDDRIRCLDFCEKAI